MTLAVLIPTLVNAKREAFLSRLMHVLQPQVDRSGVHVHCFPDSGERTTGAKRQWLLEHSEADYVVFVDDDDLVSPDYIPCILEALQSRPDVVGFRLRHFHDGDQRGRTVHSVKCRCWGQRMAPDGMMEYFRTPNHLNPIRRELALAVGYTDRTYGEDQDYSERLSAMFPQMRESFIDRELYDYLYRSQK